MGVVWSSCASSMRRPARLVDKGKPRVTWGRKATGLGEPSQPGCRNQKGRSAVRPRGFAASFPVIVAAAVRLGLIALVAFAGIASFHH